MSPDGLLWTVKRLLVPTGILPKRGPDLLQVATPYRAVVEGIDRRLPDTVSGWTGPYPLAFVFLPVLLPFLPFVLLARRRGLLPWTIEARTYPWGRRRPPIVFAYEVRQSAVLRAMEELCASLARGDGRPVLASAQHVGQPRSEFPPMVSQKDI